MVSFEEGTYKGPFEKGTFTKQELGSVKGFF